VVAKGAHSTGDQPTAVHSTRPCKLCMHLHFWDSSVPDDPHLFACSFFWDSWDARVCFKTTGIAVVVAHPLSTCNVTWSPSSSTNCWKWAFLVAVHDRTRKRIILTGKTRLMAFYARRMPPVPLQHIPYQVHTVIPYDTKSVYVGGWHHGPTLLDSPVQSTVLWKYTGTVQQFVQP
jgi:hypothetical protein